MTFRPYDHARDREAAHRIWREIGWIEKDKEEIADLAIEASRAMVAELEGSAECLVLSAAGTLRYQDEELPFAGLAGVSTSRVARKQRLAGRLTALTMALDAADGAIVAGLGMFEQGFYDRLGFGTGSYELWVGFDPATLTVPAATRPPKRVSADDWEALHAARLSRLRWHGGVNLRHAGHTRHALLHHPDKGFGLGYYDGPDGALSHYFWCDPQDIDSGPYHISWMVYRTREEFLELLGVLKNLGDQVHLVRVEEPPMVQMQDLVSQPFKLQDMLRNSRFDARASAGAYWQMRILDLAACLERTHLPCGSVRFNLVLEDPVSQYLDASAAELAWRGIAGDYVVELGSSSGCAPGHDPALPTLAATVNAFTRLWLGVRPASGLAFTDRLHGPPELLARLDEIVRLPVPHMQWDY